MVMMMAVIKVYMLILVLGESVKLWLTEFTLKLHPARVHLNRIIMWISDESRDQSSSFVPPLLFLLLHESKTIEHTLKSISRILFSLLPSINFRTVQSTS